MRNNLLPKYAFFVSGVGKHKDKLQSFDRALLASGPLAHNLVIVSSIIPSSCKIISAEKGFKLLTPGQITFCIMARQETNKKGQIVSAAVAVVRSKRSKEFGYVSEYHGNARNQAESEKIAKRLATEMFALKLHLNLKDLKPDFLEAKGASIKNAGNEWVCAVSLCVFVL